MVLKGCGHAVHEDSPDKVCACMYECGVVMVMYGILCKHLQLIIILSDAYRKSCKLY